MTEVMYEVNRDDGKTWSDDRLITIKQIPGMEPKTNTGIVNWNMFKGNPQLRATKDPELNLWTIRYASGSLPENLKMKWTSFSKMMKDIRPYFEKRGLMLVDVKDKPVEP